jgi:hypothetical protein
MSFLRSHTHWQASQAVTQTKACQRVCLPHPEKKKLKISFPAKNFINTNPQPDRKHSDSWLQNSIMTRVAGHERQERQGITRYIKNWADTTEIKGCSSLQTLYRFDRDVLRSAQLFIYRNRWQQV